DPRVSAAVNALCMRCLAPDPADRFRTAAELGQAVRRVQRRRRWRQPATLLLAGGALLVLLAVPWLLRGPRERPADLAPPPSRKAPDGRPLHTDFGLRVEMVGKTPDPTGTYHLAEGERISFRLEVDRDAYVGVWYVDQRRVTQLFPNDFDTDPLVRAGRVQAVPGNDEYAIEAEVSTGPEHVHVLASTRRWRPLVGLRGVGKDGVFQQVEGKELDLLIRGLKLVGKEKTAEAVLPFRVR